MAVNFEKLQRVFALGQCNLVKEKNRVVLKFPQMRIVLDKDFDAGMCEAALFIAKGWLKHLRETLDAEARIQK